MSKLAPAEKSPQTESAVDDDLGAGHVRGILGGQEKRHAGDLAGMGDPGQRDLLLQEFAIPGILQLGRLAVSAGAVRKMRFSSDGRRQILAFCLPGDVFGLELGDVHELSAEAVTDAEIIMVRRSLVEKAAFDDPRAARDWLKHASHKLTRARQHALILGLKSASERVGAFLLDISERFVRGQDFDLPMSRADIADYLGLTIETVSRAFTDMERRHAIDLPTSRHVVMRSRAALAHMQAA